MSFAFPFFTFFQPGIFWPQIADYRPIQILAILALLLSIGSKAEFDRTQVLRHPATKWLLLVPVTQALSVYPTGISNVLQEFMFWLVYPLFVLVSARIITGPAILRRYVWGLMIGCMWIVAFGMYAIPAGLNGTTGRAGAYGMYENHNDYSFIIIQILPFVFLFRRIETGFFARLFLTISSFACVIGIFASLSRGGMLTLVLEGLLIVMFTMTPRRQLLLVPLLAVLGVGAIGYQYAKRAENQGDSYTAEDAQASRFELWRAGGNMLKQHPIFGVGSRMFGEVSMDYAEISHDNREKNAHNTYIDLAATSGVVGFGVFMMMLVRAIRELRRPLGPEASDILAATRKAALIAFYAIMFRAFLDAKSWDWSFYTLVMFAIVTGAMMKNHQENTDAMPESPSDLAPVIPVTHQVSR